MADTAISIDTVDLLLFPTTDPDSDLLATGSVTGVVDGATVGSASLSADGLTLTYDPSLSPDLRELATSKC